MKILYFDCINGISGDMTVSALLHLGVDENEFISELKKLGLNCEFQINNTIKNGISAKTFKVIEKEHHHSHHHHTGLEDICTLINNSEISDNAKKLAIEIFTLLSLAEAKVHNTTPNEIHFHEVGAIDSIADIVSVSILMDILKLDKIICSSLAENRGFAKCEHGIIPVPVPAVVEIFNIKNVPLKILDNEKGETITPTGAAIICTLANEFGSLPFMTINKTGYGAGEKEFDKPNVLRVLYGETDIAPSSVIEISTNLDDCSPELLAYTAEKLLKCNALDVWFEPIFMKKGRPAFKLCFLCRENDKENLINFILKETTAAGVRMNSFDRVTMNREILEVKTPYGTVKVKKLFLNEIVKYIPEYESVKEIAQNTNVEFIKVYENAKNSISF